MIVTIEIIQKGALDLLSSMERLDLIRVKTPIKKALGEHEKLSERFAGALRLSDANYQAYQNTLQKGRDEWNRDTY